MSRVSVNYNGKVSDKSDHFPAPRIKIEMSMAVTFLFLDDIWDGYETTDRIGPIRDIFFFMLRYVIYTSIYQYDVKIIY